MNVITRLPHRLLPVEAIVALQRAALAPEAERVREIDKVVARLKVKFPSHFRKE
jgi:hypothetical protein